MNLSKKSLLGGSLLAGILAVPLLLAGTVNAQLPAGVLQCVVYYGEGAGDFEYVSEGCDIGLQKEVSVNGGPYFDANSSSDAVNATVGDSVVWRITLTNSVPISEIGDSYPFGIVHVEDVLPAGMAYLSSSATIGSYNETKDSWEIELVYGSSFPIVLQINTTATSSGLHVNTASLALYDPNVCGEQGPGSCDEEQYQDSNSENNSDVAQIVVSGPPVVLGDSSTAKPPQVLGLAETGSPLIQSAVAGLLILLTGAVVLIGRLKSTKAD